MNLRPNFDKITALAAIFSRDKPDNSNEQDPIATAFIVLSHSKQLVMNKIKIQR